MKAEAVAEAEAGADGLPPSQEAACRYANVEEVWADMLGELKGEHPTTWLRVTGFPPGTEANYSALLARKLADLCGDVYGEPLPADVFEDPDGQVVAVPLCAVGYQEKTMVGATTMDTCWRQQSKIRLVEVMKRVMLDGRGVVTTNECPTLVASADYRGRPLADLPLSFAHGSGSTRLMAGHCAMALLLKLSAKKVPWEVPAVKKLLKSLARMRALVVVQTAKQRAVAAMRAAALLMSESNRSGTERIDARREEKRRYEKMIEDKRREEKMREEKRREDKRREEKRREEKRREEKREERRREEKSR